MKTLNVRFDNPLAEERREMSYNQRNIIIRKLNAFVQDVYTSSILLVWRLVRMLAEVLDMLALVINDLKIRPLGRS